MYYTLYKNLLFKKKIVKCFEHEKSWKKSKIWDKQ